MAMLSLTHFGNGRILLLAFLLLQCQARFLSQHQASTPQVADIDVRGIYRIRQKSTGRLLDAYEHVQANHRPGFNVVTRSEGAVPVRDGLDHTQFWLIAREEHFGHSLMQYTSGRFLDSSNEASTDWTRNWAAFTNFANVSEQVLGQLWFIRRVGAADSNEIRIVEESSGRMLQAYEDGERDFQAYCAPPNLQSESQVWILERIISLPLPMMDGLYTIAQESTMRNLQAIFQPTEPHRWLVTRDVGFVVSQHFLLRRIRGEVYTIAQQTNGEFLGADPTTDGSANNFSVILAPVQADQSQRWLLLRMGYDRFVVQHAASGRLLDAFMDNDLKHNFRAYTTLPTLAAVDGNVTHQVWKFTKIGEMPKLDGVFRLVLNSSKLAIDAASMTKAGPGLAMSVEQGVGQFWCLQLAGGDFYRIALNGTHLALGVSAGATNVTKGTAVLEPDGIHDQLWYLEWSGDSSRFRIRHHTTGLMLTSRNTAGDVTLEPLDPNTDSAQFWDLVRVGDRRLQPVVSHTS